ncbi:hypothetical protein HAX54_023412, partial [Datura stramonium]|nr:hypothetical protein [Datura stramonium]
MYLKMARNLHPSKTRADWRRTHQSPLPQSRTAASRAVNRRRESAAATIADREQQCSPDRSADIATIRRWKKKKRETDDLRRTISHTAVASSRTVSPTGEKPVSFSDRAAAQQIEREKKLQKPVVQVPVQPFSRAVAITSSRSEQPRARSTGERENRSRRR